MSSSQSYSGIEQDSTDMPNEDELPTYDDLAAQQGPNSRFGRWGGWVEKRARERYMDITPSERERRRERGWGNDQAPEYSASQAAVFEDPQLPAIVQHPPTPGLHINTTNLNPFEHPPASAAAFDQAPQPLASEKIEGTHLCINSFGSRFLKHTHTPIRCLLPLPGGRMLLIGHENGLSVLDLYPQEQEERTKGPNEAVSKHIWHGESVLQMTLLEIEYRGEQTPNGVVLMLVGTEPQASGPFKSEPPGVLRMYTLASLISLAQWALKQEDKQPLLDIRRLSDANGQHSHKKHRTQNSIARSFRALLDSPNSSAGRPQLMSSHQGEISPASSVASLRLSEQDTGGGPTLQPLRRQSNDSEWSVVNKSQLDPMRWAADFTAFATPTSRLFQNSVISYAVWGVDNPATASRQDRYLAIATKSSIFLYEAPKGARSFQFSKDFYTPLVPRNLTFFRQIPYVVARSPSNGSTRHKRNGTSKDLKHEPSRETSEQVGQARHDPQLSLFVVYEKKAGWIRIVDAAVGQFEFTSDPGSQALTGSSPSRLSRISIDYHNQSSAPRWARISHCEIPRLKGSNREIYLLTKETETQIMPCPLPTVDSDTHSPPLCRVKWAHAPSHVQPRVSLGTRDKNPTYLQLVSTGEHGVEVQEILISSINFPDDETEQKDKGKGKAPAVKFIRGATHAGGDTGFLCTGGHWNDPTSFGGSAISRTSSTASGMTYDSSATTDTEALMKRTEGMYAWSHGIGADWRIVWLGGPLSENIEVY